MTSPIYMGIKMAPLTIEEYNESVSVECTTVNNTLHDYIKLVCLHAREELSLDEKRDWNKWDMQYPM